MTTVSVADLAVGQTVRISDLWPDTEDVVVAVILRISDVWQPDSVASLVRTFTAQFISVNGDTKDSSGILWSGTTVVVGYADLSDTMEVVL